MTFEGTTSVDYSRSINEPLYGSVKPFDVYFLLEYNGIYTPHVWEESNVPQAVKAKLDAYPKSKSLLIRQPAQAASLDKQISFFVVHANQETPVIYRLDLPNYEAVLELDLADILAGNAPVWDEPLYAVCCNGRRDVCCSTYGVPVYSALSAYVGDAVWQSSHIGGHRHAGTLYAFPHAYCYGRLDGADAPEVVRAYENGIVSLSHLRGRGIYSKPVQAAEYFLRRDLQNKKIKSLTFVNVTTTEKVHEIRFDVDGVPYYVRISEDTPIMTLSTTGDADLSPMPNWQCEAIHNLA